MLTHKNLVHTLFSIITSVDIKATPNDAYLAYLPLVRFQTWSTDTLEFWLFTATFLSFKAHVLELISEMLVLVNGVRLGYSNPNTMINSSSMVKKGQFGDAVVLRPSIMGAVPLILDRLNFLWFESLKMV
jgi:long-subunit acyl-CoA synthetase (AMP-forming)